MWIVALIALVGVFYWVWRTPATDAPIAPEEDLPQTYLEDVRLRMYGEDGALSDVLRAGLVLNA